MNNSIEIDVQDLSFYYKNDGLVLNNIALSIYKNSITAIMGPSGCGKTTLLRCLNRIHDLYPGNKYNGSIVFQGRNILENGEDMVELRRKIGMVFQKPTPLPLSIFDNVAYGLKLQGERDKEEISATVEKYLTMASLWDEVKDKLESEARELSTGQQQRLVIARALAVKPMVLLFDEATSALDPSSTSLIEQLIEEIKNRITVVMVTHNVQQAERIADIKRYMENGILVQ